MKRLLILCCIINGIWAHAQISESPTPEKRRVFIGIDVAQPLMQFFTEKAGYEMVFSIPIKTKWEIAGEAGYESNLYNENSWKVNVEGAFARLGANWVVGKDTQNPNMNFYLGGRLGYARFTQTVDQFLIQGTNVPNAKGSLPKHNASAVWMAPVIGARVPVGNSNFYIDASAQTEILLNSSNDYSIDALAIPGFGYNNNGLNLRIIWAIGYTF